VLHHSSMTYASDLRRIIPTICICAIALLGPFFFPWPFAVVVGIVAAFFFPPIAIVIGGLIDALYFGGFSAGIPYFTVCGVLVAIGAAFVHDFLKTRIMS
jgi:hypothetical protein